MEPKYKLIPEEVPRISKAAVYEKMLDEFASSKAATVRVEMPKNKPSTIHQGLLKMKRTTPRFANVSVVRRGDAIYLKK